MGILLRDDHVMVTGKVRRQPESGESGVEYPRSLKTLAK